MAHDGQAAPPDVLVSVMRPLAVAFLMFSAVAAPVLAQPQDPAVRRLSLALQQPRPPVGGLVLGTVDDPKTFGIFTVVAPELRGEMIRVSLPIGALVTQAYRGVAARNRRRQEQAARRQVQADLRRFNTQLPPQP